MPIKDPTKQNTREWAYLDDEVCFDLWNDTGNQRKAAQVLADRGLVNPDTGKPPTPGGVYVAALRYAIWNPDQARQKIVNAGGEWARDKLKFLTWIFERANKQSNLIGAKKREKFNDEILDFVAGYLEPNDYEKFLQYYNEVLCPEEDCEEEELVPA